MVRRPLARPALLVATLLIPVLAGAGPRGEVDDARLVGAGRDAANWLSAGHGYDNHRFSALARITAANVASLAPAWTFRTGLKASFQATPIVVDGVMYATTPFNHVVALDAATGRLLWRYEHRMSAGKLCCGPANRGAAVGYGRVFMATADARLLALDQATGKLLWDVRLARDEGGETERLEDLPEGDPLRKAGLVGDTGFSASMAPLLYKGKVIVGVAGAGYGLHLDTQGPERPLGAVVGFAGRYGRRGFYAAFDAATGREAWRWHTVPERGWEGEWRPSTPDGAPLHRDLAAERAALALHPDAWRTGGGSAWTTPALDPDLGLLFVGVGNPAPQFDDLSRPGDNLFTVSLVALDAETGRPRWHYQQVPHDRWGYDVASPPLLFETEVGGRRVAAVGQAGKTGWFYVHDRRTGALLRKSEPFVPQQNLFAPPTPDGVLVAPGAGGGASWSPAAYDPRNGTVFVTGVHMPMRFTVRTRPADEDRPAQRYIVAAATDEPRWGTLSAIDTRTGKIRWQQKLPEPQIGGVLATAGDLVFVGEGNGSFDAFDSGTGKLLWQSRCDAGVNAPPIAYEVGGRQYVAVAAGGNALFGYPQGDGIHAFALPK